MNEEKLLSTTTENTQSFQNWLELHDTFVTPKSGTAEQRRDLAKDFEMSAKENCIQKTETLIQTLKEILKASPFFENTEKAKEYLAIKTAAQDLLNALKSVK